MTPGLLVSVASARRHKRGVRHHRGRGGLCVLLHLPVGCSRSLRGVFGSGFCRVASRPHLGSPRRPQRWGLHGNYSIEQEKNDSAVLVFYSYYRDGHQKRQRWLWTLELSYSTIQIIRRRTQGKFKKKRGCARDLEAGGWRGCFCFYS